jgi:hypothetical protein
VLKLLSNKRKGEIIEYESKLQFEAIKVKKIEEELGVNLVILEEDGGHGN